MNFEWDQAKNQANQTKHGIGFEEALSIWEGFHVDVEEIAHSGLEERSATLGLIQGRVYLAIWTWRKRKIRLISVRRARKNEEKVYQEKFRNHQSDG